MLHAQIWLRGGQSLDELTAQFGIIVKRHPQYPNLVHLKYNQLTSPMADPLVRQCRGLILDEAADWNVVAYPFDKFFNYGEERAAPVDWSTARFYEKLDGSLMYLYWYDDKWHVSSSGNPAASGSVWPHGFTFADLFWETWNSLGYQFPWGKKHDVTCIFELMTPHNRVVVRHSKPRLVFIGARSNNDFREYPVEPISSICGWKCVPHWTFPSLSECFNQCKSLNPIEQEGFVACDRNFNRVKIKSDQYVLLHQMKCQVTPRSLLDLARRNEGDELLTHFPEYRADYEPYRELFVDLTRQIECNYGVIQGIESQKEFAAQALPTGYSWVLFLMRRNGQSAADLLADCHIEKVERLLGIKEVPDVAIESDSD
jgi:hypothetical protein